MNRDGSLLPVLIFPDLEQAGAGGAQGASGMAQHMITMRRGGVSSGIYATLNLSFGRGDDDANVHENIRRVAAAFGTDEAHMVFSHQVHETNVLRVTAADAGMGVTRPMEWPSADGLVTNEPGLVLGAFFADCVPLLFLDPVHRAVGVSHSGWRGTAGRIGRVTLEVMSREFGTDPADVLVGIGPSICQDHYEVSEDVAARFREEFPDGAEGAECADPGAGAAGIYAGEAGGEVRRTHPMLRYAGRPGHMQLDLWEACRVTLLEAGVPEENIHVTDICTCCNPDLLFSHRASHGRRGNIGAFIMLRYKSDFAKHRFEDQTTIAWPRFVTNVSSSSAARSPEKGFSPRTV